MIKLIRIEIDEIILNKEISRIQKIQQLLQYFFNDKELN